MIGYDNTTLMISNEGMNDIIKIIKSFKETRVINKRC